MIEQRYKALLSDTQNDIAHVQERIASGRQTHDITVGPFASIRGSLHPFLTSPIQTLRRVPPRYLLHTVVALAVPVALGLSQLPTRPLEESVTQSTFIAQSPYSAVPVIIDRASDGSIVGDPPLPVDAIPVPMSLTSRSEALAPIVVAGMVVPDTEAELRTGPGLDYDQLGFLNGDTALQVVGRAGEWLQINIAGGETAWVASEMVSIADQQVHMVFEVQPQDIPAVPAPKVATVTEEGLRLRDGPSTEYVRMMSLTAGQEVSLIQQHGEWVHVAGDNFNGWVDASYLEIGEGVLARVPTTESIPNPHPSLAALINENGVNMRSGPSTGHEMVGQIDAGAQVNLLEQYDNWFKIETGYGEVAWVYGSLLDMSSMVQRRVPGANDVSAPAVASSAPASATESESYAETIEPAAPPPSVAAAQPAPAAEAVIAVPSASQPVVSGSTSTGLANEVAQPLPVVQDEPAAPAPAVPQAPQVRDIQSPAVPEPAVPQDEIPAAPPAPEPAAPAQPAAQPSTPPLAAPVAVPASGDVASYSLQFVGYPYIWGGASPGGFDCSGFTMYVYAQFGVYLPHNAAAQFSTAYGAPVNGIGNLAPGDIVFFAGTAGPGITHVGLSLGGGRVIHAMAPGYGVQVSNLYDGYWLAHYAGAIRPYR